MTYQTYTPEFSTRNRKARTAAAFSPYAGFIIKFLLLFLIFMGVLVCQLFLSQKTVKSIDRTNILRQETENVKAEIINLRNQVAKLESWPHIQARIRKFNLPLVQAVPGQIINIGVYTPQQAAKIPLTPLTVASRAGKNSGTYAR